jgi:hydroxyproline transport system permease protein
LFPTSFTLSDLQFMLYGTYVTLAVTFWAMLGGTLLGVIFGVVRTVAPKWVELPFGLVLDVFRSVPLLIQLILFNSLQSIVGVRASNFQVSCIILAIYTSAFCSQIVYGGIMAVPQSLRRAARSLGMSWRQDMTLIVLPLALRIMFPTWIGLTLSVLKDSALVSWLGIIELLRSSQIIVTRIQEPLFVLIVAGLIYFVLSFPVARLGGILERRWREND